MPENTNRVEVPGSEKAALPETYLVGPVPPDERFQITVRVRRQAALPSLSAQADQPPAERTYMTRDALVAQHGASADDLEKVAAFARTYGLTVDDSDAARRSVLLSGTTAQFEQAFSVTLRRYAPPGGDVRGRSGPIFVPSDLDGIVVGVFGLDNRIFAKAQYRLKRHHKPPAAPPTAFYPAEIAKLYDFPTDVTGQGQKIGIVELGGGFRQSELDTYFAEAGAPSPPTVTVATFAGGGTNSPGTDPLDPANPDIEVMLDIQVAGSVAPGAEIVLYFAKDASDQGFLDAMTAAITDPQNALTAISVSWGGPEAGKTGTGSGTGSGTTAQFQDNFDQALQAAAHLGITVCVASGDSGSANFAANDPSWDGGAHVDFPASSPYALGCGGTQITVAGGALTDEVVWHSGQNIGSGGGVSRYFALPSYQANANVPPATNPAGPVMRGVPDVSGNAASESGYRVLCDGQEFPDPSKQLPGIGGTSAVAPLWAGLIALLAQGLGAKLGWVNPLLYPLAPSTGAFHDITVGNNGDYQAAPGWDPCTGLGSPDGQKLRDALHK